MSSTKNVLESFRDVAQDVLVPELKAVKISVDALRTEIKLNTEALREEMKLTKDALREETKIRHEPLTRMMQMESERNDQQIRNLGEKFDIAIDIRERLASVEARMPKQ